MFLLSSALRSGVDARKNGAPGPTLTGSKIKVYRARKTARAAPPRVTGGADEFECHRLIGLPEYARAAIAGNACARRPHRNLRRVRHTRGAGIVRLRAQAARIGTERRRTGPGSRRAQRCATIFTRSLSLGRRNQASAKGTARRRKPRSMAGLCQRRTIRNRSREPRFPRLGNASTSTPGAGASPPSCAGICRMSKRRRMVATA
jgi:hypothetical protein